MFGDYTTTAKYKLRRNNTPRVANTYYGPREILTHKNTPQVNKSSPMTLRQKEW